MTNSVTISGTIVDVPIYTPGGLRREAETSFILAREQGDEAVLIEVHGLDAQSARHLHRGDRVAVNGAITNGPDGSAHTMIANRVALITNQKPAVRPVVGPIANITMQKGATLRGVLDRNLDAASPTNQIDAPRR